jgi:hypothetical protein
MVVDTKYNALFKRFIKYILSIGSFNDEELDGLVEKFEEYLELLSSLNLLTHDKYTEIIELFDQELEILNHRTLSKEERDSLCKELDYLFEDCNRLRKIRDDRQRLNLEIIEIKKFFAKMKRQYSWQIKRSIQRSQELSTIQDYMSKLSGSEEIEELYDTLKRFIDGRENVSENACLNYILNYYDNKKGWGHVKRKYLEHKNIYLLNPSNHRRDFLAHLLADIFKDQGLTSMGGLELFKLYRNMLPNRKKIEEISESYQSK